MPKDFVITGTITRTIAMIVEADRPAEALDKAERGECTHKEEGEALDYDFSQVKPKPERDDG